MNVDYLIDTNVLIRFSDPAQLQHAIALAAVQTLWNRGDKLSAVGQNFVEFWNVSTRPIVRNGLGALIAKTDDDLKILESFFPLLLDLPAIYPEWRRLVVAYGVLGVKVYDARLVAAMKVHGFSHILTFNTADFTRYAAEGIVPIDPSTV